MKRHSTILKSAIAMALGLGAASAFAGTLTVTPVQYAVEDIGTGTQIQVGPGKVYYEVAVGKVLNAGDSLSFAMAGGASFGNIPGVSTDPALPLGVSLEQTIANASIAQFKVVGGTIPASTKIKLNSFSVVVPATFSASANCDTPNNVNITVAGSFSGGDQPGTTGTATSNKFLTSCDSSTLALGGWDEKADITTAATKFVVSKDFASATKAQIATAQRADNFVNVRYDGSLISADAVTKTTTINVVGNFSGISGIEARVNACDAASAGDGKIDGSIDSTASSAKLVGNFKSGTPYKICVTASGTARVANNNQFSASGSTAYSAPTAIKGSGVTNYSAEDIGRISYNGSEIPATFVVGGSTGYSNYIRVVNTTNLKSDLYASVAPDSGTNAVFGKIGTLEPYASRLITASDLNTATGSKLEKDSDKANVSIFGTGSDTTLDGGNIILNTDGSVTSVP